MPQRSLLYPHQNVIDFLQVHLLIAGTVETPFEKPLQVLTHLRYSENSYSDVLKLSNKAQDCKIRYLGKPACWHCPLRVCAAKRPD
jgi:hypothetical protein